MSLFVVFHDVFAYCICVFLSVVSTCSGAVGSLLFFVGGATTGSVKKAQGVFFDTEYMNMTVQCGKCMCVPCVPGMLIHSKSFGDGKKDMHINCSTQTPNPKVINSKKNIYTLISRKQSRKVRKVRLSPLCLPKLCIVVSTS